MQDGPQGTGKTRAPLTIPGPADNQGVCDALRNAYRQSAMDLPEDLKRLLARLR